MKKESTKQPPTTVNPIGLFPNTIYPEIVCPDCKKHFAWSKKDKEFYCSCGEILVVESDTI